MTDEVPEQEDVQIGFRIPVILRDKLQDLARKNDRTMSAEVRRAVENHVSTKE